MTWNDSNTIIYCMCTNFDDMSTTEFSTQFDRLSGSLFAFAMNLTRDEESARDLVQETAYKAFKYRRRYEPQTNLRAWLMTIMRNSFINDYRKRQRRQTLNDYTNNNYLLNSGSRSVENGGEQSVLIEEINRQIEALDDWVKRPFRMHLAGYKYDEIADALNVPLGTVKSRIFIARKRLQESLRYLYQANGFSDIMN